MGALPELKIEAAWSATPADILAQNGSSPPAIAWTDITAHVHLAAGISTDRGRQSEDDAVSAGSLTLTLKPSATSLTSLMRLRTPLRLSIRYPRTTGSWTPLWTGTVDDWGIRWENGLRVVMPLHASDMVARFAAKPIEALPVQAILATGPVWCYPLDEEAGATAAADRAAVRTSTPLLTWLSKGTVPADQAASFGDFGGLYSPGSPPTQAESTTAKFAPSTSGADGRYLSSGSSASYAFPEIGTVADGQTIQAFVYVAGTSSRTTSVLDLRGWLTDVALDLMPSWKPRARVQMYGPGIVAEVTAATAITTEGWHHVALTQKQTGSTVTLTLYVDGTSAGTATYAGPLLTAGSFEISAGAFAAGDLFFGNLANIAAHDRALTATEIAEIASTRNGIDGQGAVARAHAIARWSGLSARTPTTGLGDSLMQAQATRGGSVADALGTAAVAELSPWYVKADGTFTMTNRAAFYSPAPAFTVPARAISQSTEFVTNDQFLTNKVLASRPGGATITAQDAASIRAYETYQRDLNVLLTTDLAVTDYANAYVARYREPQPRSDAIGMYMTAASADLDAGTPGTVAAIIAAEVGSAFTISGLPGDAPSSTMTFTIQGIADEFTTTGWTRSFNVSAAQTIAAWKLGDPAYSLLGTTTVLAF